MKEIKLWFTDFYDGFDPADNILYHFLAEIYSIKLDQKDPEFLIYSCYSNDFLNYDCVKIFYTGENIKPDFNLCDYAIGFDYLEFNDRYLRFPNFVFYEEQFKALVIEEEDKLVDLSSKKHFCNFIYSNANADPRRDNFYHLLSSYKEVASAGKHLNNTAMAVGERYSNDWMFSKIAFQSSCKFSIAFENASSPGYTTEKLLHALISRTVPIYWGNSEVTKDFNPKAFINCHDYRSFEDVVEKVEEIDRNKEMFLSIVNETPFRNNIVPQNLKKKKLIGFLKNILDQDKEQALRRSRYGTVKKYNDDLKDLVAVKNRFRKLNNLFKRLNR